jgi:hypothetical protein
MNLLIAQEERRLLKGLERYKQEKTAAHIRYVSAFRQMQNAAPHTFLMALNGHPHHIHILYSSHYSSIPRERSLDIAAILT